MVKNRNRKNLTQIAQSATMVSQSTMKPTQVKKAKNISNKAGIEGLRNMEFGAHYKDPEKEEKPGENHCKKPKGI